MTENSKETIVEAALNLFATRGYDSTPISLIAKTAQVSQGLMYNFFPSKEALLGELMNRGFEDIKRSMKSYLDVAEPREAIRVHVETTIAIIKRHSRFWRLLHAIRLQGKVVETAQPLFQEIVTNVTHTFSSVFSVLGYPNPQLEAMLFLAQIDGLVILFLQDEQNVPIDQLGQQLIQRYIS
ncbi:MAG: TetR/AcrR family transcriptional regulator [Cyclobacteriaceae bacterium]